MARVIKILVVGSSQYFMYAPALTKAFNQIVNIEAELFDTSDYYFKGEEISLRKRFELKYAMGIGLERLNRELVIKCIDFKPDIVFFYSCRDIYNKTLDRLKEDNVFLIGYCNDDAFSEKYSWFYWRRYRANIKKFDINYVYRSKNINDIINYNGKNPLLLRAYYIKEQNYTCSREMLIKDIPDVIYLGHYEEDGRREYIDALIKSGIKIGLSKHSFEKLYPHNENVILIDNATPNKNNNGDYNLLLASCKIPLVFLSGINNDTYTRRCFEIPAAGNILFCPYTSDLATLFEEEKEIVFYRNIEEFIKKIKYYLEHEEERKRVAYEGRCRLLKEGHEVMDRARQIVNDYITLHEMRCFSS